MSINWITRAETSADIPTIHDITLAAFDTPLEADLVDALRADPSWIDGLSIVTTDQDGKLIGHALLTRCHIDDTPALCLGPVAVRPEYQKTGAGFRGNPRRVAGCQGAGRALRHRPRTPDVLPAVRLHSRFRVRHRTQHRCPGRGHDGPHPRRRPSAAQRHCPLRRTVRHLVKARRAGVATEPRHGGSRPLTHSAPDRLQSRQMKRNVSLPSRQITKCDRSNRPGATERMRPPEWQLERGLAGGPAAFR